MLSDAINLLANNLDLGILFIPLVVALFDGKPSTNNNTYSDRHLDSHVDRQLTRANTEAMRRLSNEIENSKYKL